MHTLHANFRSSAETHLLSIRHAVEVFLFLQHFSRHSGFRMRLRIQLMQNDLGTGDIGGYAIGMQAMLPYSGQ
jgi:hypothetical protein